MTLGKLPLYKFATSRISRELFEGIQDALQSGESVRSIRIRFRQEGYRFSNQAITNIKRELNVMKSESARFVRNDYFPKPIKSGRNFSNTYRYYGVGYYTVIDLEGKKISHRMEHKRSITMRRRCEQELPLMFQDAELLRGRTIRERLESLAENSIETMNLHAEKYEAEAFILERVFLTNVLESYE